MILGKLCQETMRLESFTRIIQPITARGPLNFDIEGIAYDSRQVRKNFLFVAIHGAHADGSAYIDDALRRVAHRRQVAQAGLDGLKAICEAPPHDGVRARSHLSVFLTADIPAGLCITGARMVRRESAGPEASELEDVFGVAAQEQVLRFPVEAEFRKSLQSLGGLYHRVVGAEENLPPPVRLHVVHEFRRIAPDGVGRRVDEDVRELGRVRDHLLVPRVADVARDDRQLGEVQRHALDVSVIQVMGLALVVVPVLELDF